VTRFRRGCGGVQFDALAAPAVLLGILAAGSVHEDAAHGLRCGGEEVTAPVPPRGVRRSDQAQVRLVDQRGGVEGVVGASLAIRAAAS
jgi:hypothetical protein